jgi:rhodanese-related sulfurtransferase
MREGNYTTRQTETRCTKEFFQGDCNSPFAAAIGAAAPRQGEPCWRVGKRRSHGGPVLQYTATKARKNNRPMQTTQPESTGNPPGWLLPVLIVAVILLGIVATMLLTETPRPEADESIAAPVLDQTAAAAHGSATQVAAAPPPVHGIDPNGPEVQRVSVEEARAFFDTQTTIFIDVRTGADYEAGHIPGALTITRDDIQARLEDARPDTVIIAYGDGERPDSAARGAQIFMQLGFPQVIALEGGFQAWQAANLPTEP